MKTDDSADTTIDLYLPAVVRPRTDPGPIEWLLTAPFRRDRAARMRSR